MTIPTGETPPQPLRRRAIAPVLLALALLCFLLPFATVGCDDPRTTVSGMDLVAVRGPVSEEPDESGGGVQAGVAAATVAFAAASAGILAALVPGAIGAASTFVAAGYAFGALLALALTGYLRVDSLFVDLRFGFWLALALVGGALVAARRGWQLVAPEPWSTARRAAVVAGLLLVGASLLPGTIGDDYFDVTIASALSPESRSRLLWDAVAALGLPFLVLVCALLLDRSSNAARALAALGLAGVAAAVASLGLTASADFALFGDKPYFLLGASALAVWSGVRVARVAAPAERAADGLPRILAATGAATLCVSLFVPYDGRGSESALSPIETDPGALTWLALPPLALAVATLVLVAFAPRLLTGTSTGLALGAALVLLPFLYPVFIDEESTSFAPGAVVGLVGACLIGAAAIVQARLRPVVRAHEPVVEPGGV